MSLYVHALLVEDEPAIRRLLDVILRQMGLQVTTCSRGDIAIDLLRIEAFDLLVTDLNMPGAHGSLVMAAAEYYHSHLPAILMSAAESFPTDRARCSATWLAKPFGITQFIHSVRDILSEPCRCGIKR